MEIQAKVKKKAAFFDVEHKIGLIVFLIMGLIGIPWASFNSNAAQTPALTRASVNKSRVKLAFDPHTGLQVEAFDPTIYGTKITVAHASREIIVRFLNTVDIKTKFGANPDSQEFKVSDITSGLPQSEISALKSFSVASIEKVVKNPTGDDKWFVTNLYKLTISSGISISSAMQGICSDDTIVLYCEPNYKFDPAVFSQDAANSSGPATTQKAVTIGIVDQPFPANYVQVASSLGLPAISSGQIMPGADTPATESANALLVAAAIYKANPNAQFKFWGVCGANCSESAIAKAIVDAVNQNVNAIYLGQATLFPKDVVPEAIKTAAEYALSKGVVVVAPTGNVNSTATAYASDVVKTAILGASTRSKNRILLADDCKTVGGVNACIGGNTQPAGAGPVTPARPSASGINQGLTTPPKPASSPTAGSPNAPPKPAGGAGQTLVQIIDPNTGKLLPAADPGKTWVRQGLNGPMIQIPISNLPNGGRPSGPGAPGNSALMYPSAGPGNYMTQSGLQYIGGPQFVAGPQSHDNPYNQTGIMQPSASNPYGAGYAIMQYAANGQQQMIGYSLVNPYGGNSSPITPGSPGSGSGNAPSISADGSRADFGSGGAGPRGGDGGPAPGGGAPSLGGDPGGSGGPF